MAALLLAVCFLLQSLLIGESTHFRGGIIQWKPVNDSTTVSHSYLIVNKLAKLVAEMRKCDGLAIVTKAAITKRLDSNAIKWLQLCKRIMVIVKYGLCMH